MLVGRWNVLLSPGPFSVDCFPFFFVYIFYFPPVSYQQKSWKFRRHRSSQPTRGSSKVHLETTSLMGSTPLERRFVGGLVGTKFSQICHWKPGPFFFLGLRGRKPDRRAPTLKFLRCDVAVFWAKAIIKKLKNQDVEKVCEWTNMSYTKFPKKSFIWNTQLGSW